MHRAKLAPLRSLHQSKPGPLPSLHEGKLAPLPSLHQGKLGPLPSLHQGKLAPLPPVHQGKLAPLPSLHQGKPGPLPSLHEGKLAPLPSLHQGKLAPLPPVHQGKLAPLPSLHQSKPAPLPTVHQDKLAPLPTVHQGKLAPHPPSNQGRPAPLPSWHQRTLAPRPTVHQEKLAPLPPVHQGKLAPLPSLHQGKPAPLPTVHQDKLAPLPPVHQGKPGPLPSLHEGKLAPLPSLHQGKPGPLPSLHEGKLAPLPSLHQGKPGPLPSLHEGKLAPLPSLHQGKLAPLPPVHQGKLAPLPSLHQGKPAPLPTVHQDKLAPLPTVHQGKLAPHPPSNQGRPAPLPSWHQRTLAPRPTVHQEKLAPLPPVHQGKLAPLPSLHQGKPAPLPTVHQDKLAPLPPVHQGKLAPLPSLHQGKPAPLPTVHQDKLAPLPTVHQGKLAPHPPSNQGRPAPLPSWHLRKLAPRPTVHQEKLAPLPSLHQGKPALSEKLKETTSQLQLKGGELLDSETALKNRSAKDLTEKEQAQKTLQLELQKKVDQVKDDLHRRDNEVEGLSQKIKETSQLSLKGGELLDSETVWQEKFKALKDRSAKKLAKKEQAWKTLQLELQKTVDQVQDELHRRGDRIEGLSQKLRETTSQLQLKGGELLDSKTVWQDKFKTLEDRSAKDLAEKEQAQKTLQLELQKKVDQVQDELHRRDDEIEGLSQKLKETTSQLSLKGGELLDSKTVWQEKFKALEDRSAKDLAEKEQAQKTLQLELQKKVDQVKDELHRRDNEVEGLSQKIKETSQLQLKGGELLDSETVWQEKFKALKVRSAKKLAKKEQAWKTLQLELQKKVDQVQDELHRRDNEVEGLSQKLKETTSQLQLKGGELLDSETVWQEKFKALEDRSAKDLAKKEQAWKTLQLELQKKVDQVQDELSKTVCKNAQTLANNQQLEKQIQKVQEENKDLAEKVQRMHTRVRQMEVDLANKQHRWETKIKQLEKDNEDLEELCLNLNKKRGFFSRKRDTEDRQEELQKLKSKMHDKKMKKKEKEKAQMKPTDEKVEINLEEQTEKRMKSFLSRQCDGENQVEEAAGCSAQAPPPFSSPTSLQPHLPPSSTSPDDFIIYHPPPSSLLPAWLIPVLRFPSTKSTSSSRKYKK
ncbi:uncharacterized protein LOC141756274 isoform X1 [Sebastes fasciatus]|uniref:uncharacterized protein LOC141756274 isoform X1 n=1 Tax=Sebastes fasciatus TaxID=394691 RepID=UPI003D9E0A2B